MHVFSLFLEGPVDFLLVCYRTSRLGCAQRYPQRGACKGGIRLLLLSVGFRVDVWAGLSLEQHYGEGKKEN